MDAKRGDHFLQADLSLLIGPTWITSGLPTILPEWASSGWYFYVPGILLHLPFSDFPRLIGVWVDAFVRKV
jgi:hypothetical protein